MLNDIYVILGLYMEYFYYIYYDFNKHIIIDVNYLPLEHHVCTNEDISKKIKSLDNDSKYIHRLSAQILDRKQKPPLPHATHEQQPIIFGTFLHNISLPHSNHPSTVIECDCFFHEFILLPLSHISPLFKTFHR